MNEAEQDPPEMPACWETDCHGKPQRVAITLPSVWDEPPEENESRDAQADVLLGLLRFIIGDYPDITRAGGRAHLLAFLAGASRFKTQRELGQKLKLSDGRISQIRAEIQGILPSLEKCNRRQTKTRRIVDSTIL